MKSGTTRPKPIITTLVIGVAAALVLFLSNREAVGHKVNVFAYVENDRVVVEGYFSASVKAKDCPVEVFDERAKKIHEGKTDQKGTYSFKTTDLPAFTGGLRIVLEGGMGHKAKYTLKASDIPGSVAKAPLPKDQPRTNQSEVTPETAVVGSTQIVDQAALMTAVEAAVDKKLDPLVKMLGKQEKLLLEQKYGGPRLSDVVGGIGWIVGLVGLAAFFWGRNRPPRN